MDENYRAIIRTLRVSKRLGQSFLVNREVARAEANFGAGRVVVEMGPGLGILTAELCGSAKRVLAVERDPVLYGMLGNSLKAGNLELVNGDFFKVPESKFRGCEIMISNIPYGLSSKTLMWLCSHSMPAVLCLQKEFVEHMAAEPGSRNYSRLSVMAGLLFTCTQVLDVPSGNFYPRPRVDSVIVYLRPKKIRISKRVSGMIAAIMSHKKKKLRNAIMDSEEALGVSRESAARIADSIGGGEKRPFQMGAGEILTVAERIAKEAGGGK